MLLRELRSEGHEVWVYTTSLREPVRLRLWFAALGVRLEGIVNGTRHAVVAAEQSIGCSKYPPHLLTQIAGKARLALTPWVNHSWHVPFYVSPRGLTTGAIPYRGQCFELTFDLLRHRLLIDVSDGTEKVLALGAGSVAQFYSAPKGPQRSRAIRLAS